MILFIQNQFPRKHTFLWFFSKKSEIKNNFIILKKIKLNQWMI